MDRVEIKHQKNGDTVHLLNGWLHNTLGPAVRKNDGSCEWYLDGLRHSEDEWKIIMKSRNKIKEIEIEKFKPKLK